MTGDTKSQGINSLAPGRFQFNFRSVIFKLTLVNGGSGISYEIALWCMPQDITDDKSTLVQAMAWCRQATSHCLSQCWPRSMSPNGVTRPQWVNTLRPRQTCTIPQMRMTGNTRDQDINTLRPRQNGRHFADDIFKYMYIFLKENVWIPIKMKFVIKGPINNTTALVQIMACRWRGDKPLSEPMMLANRSIYASLGLNELSSHSIELVILKNISFSTWRLNLLVPGEILL